MYVMYLGIEVAGRTATIMLILLLLLGLATNILILMAGIIDMGNILPIAEHGWQPIWQVVYSQAVMLPYGEMVTFAMILPTLKKNYRANGVGGSAILFGGLLLSMVTLSNVLALGEDVLMALSYQDHLQTGELVLKWLFPIFSIFFPILLLIVSWLRKIRNKKGEENVS